MSCTDAYGYVVQHELSVPAVATPYGKACCADQVLTEWKKKTKNDAATRLASVLHAVSTWSQQQLVCHVL